MENTKEIIFDKDILIKNSTVKLIYSGFLVNSEPEKIYIKYCFDNNWSNFFEKELYKTDDGYEISIELGNNTCINMCFKDSNDTWDNNNFNDYIFQIKTENTDLVVTSSGLPYLPKKGLRKTYIWSKKVRILIYKLFRTLPRFITGNYRRRINL